MKKLLLLAFGCFIAATLKSFGQEYSIQVTKENGDTTMYVKLKTVVIHVTDGMITTMETPLIDTARLFISQDGEQLIGTTVWKRAVKNWAIAAVIENDNTSAIAYSSISPADPKGWYTNAPEAKFYNDNFAWIPQPNGTQRAGVRFSSQYPVRISFMSERSAGHNPYDLVFKANNIVKDSVRIDPRLPPINTDEQRQVPSYVSKQLNPSAPNVMTDYLLVIKPTGQMVIDRITVEVLR